MPHSTRSRYTSGLALALVIVTIPLPLTACADSESGPDPAPMATAGEGTLLLDDARYDFDIDVCDFSGEADGEYQTIAAAGVTPDGEEFDLFVSRNDIGGILTHTISFQTGNVARGEGVVIEAQRMRISGAWSSLHGSADGPLIVIEDNTLTASGAFSPTNDPGTTLEGELTATCA